MRASNPETIYSAGTGDWTQARLITVSGLARTVPMSHRDNCMLYVMQDMESADMSASVSAAKSLLRKRLCTDELPPVIFGYESERRCVPA